MISRYGVIGSEVDGVFFTEATSLPDTRDLGEVKAQLGGQNKDLRHLKVELARQVRTLGGNGLIGFTYGQRGNPWWGSFGIVDSEHWHGSGHAVVLPPERAPWQRR